MIAKLRDMVVFVEAKPSKAVQKRVDELDRNCQCVVCQRKCGPGERWRGRCNEPKENGDPSCYSEYDSLRRPMSSDERAAFDAKLITEGLLLGDRQGQRVSRPMTETAAIAAEVKS